MLYLWLIWQIGIGPHRIQGSHIWPPSIFRLHGQSEPQKLAAYSNNTQIRSYCKKDEPSK